MKKIFYLATIVTLILSTVFLSACGGSTMDIAKQNLSEVRYNVFSGQNDTWTASFMSGKRENPYIVNGKSESKTDFGLLTITFKGADTPLNASYKLTIDNVEKSGDLEYNQYENNFMVDINQIVNDDAVIKVFITVGNTTTSADLVCNSKDFEISWQTALNIAVPELENKIKENTSNGKLKGELYIKIITDLNGDFDDYFWYVYLYTTNGDTYGVIINPITGEVLAQSKDS